MPGLSRDDQEWLPDEWLDEINCQRIVDPPELTDAERARKILTQNAPIAAQSIAWLARRSTNENVRLRASQYIIDGVVGGTFKAEGGEDDILMMMVNQLAANDDLAKKR